MKKHDQGTYEYLRHHKRFPHLWCAGCGIGIVMGSVLRSVQKLELNQDDVAVISGIGCTGRMPVYMDFNTMHTTHGRALAFATGLKLARPELEIIVIMGDGDALAIGGNHFIHAARRNIDITAIVVNNNIYGMTGGQSSPTTPLDARSATAPYGHIEQPFPIVDLAMAAGAPFVARSTVYHVTELDRLVEQAVRKEGFALVEAVSYCHTTFGRANNIKSPIAMMRQLKDNSISLQAAEKLGDELAPEQIVRGIFRDDDRPEYTQLYDEIIERAHGPLPPRKRKVRRGWV
ncbi:MAG: 2-oxoacid:ferredoxin oxidoreductase subunit beta [Anaerolineae bacterium]|jgi:2-oxoglutarate/2-oxoacid ferredoxin oxidoreductase subunit beta